MNKIKHISRKTFKVLIATGLLGGCASYNPITNKLTVKTQERNNCFKSCGPDKLCQQSCQQSCDKYGCGENKGAKGLRFSD